MDFIKVGAASHKLKISDTKYNLKEIETMILNAIEEEVKVLVFPELSISAYSCGDLFTNEKLIENCNLAIKNLVEFSKGKDILMAVGAPFLYRYSLYNCAYVILNGKVLGIVPKSYIPNYSEFYEKRWFTEGFNIKGLNVDLDFQKEVPFGTDLIFSFKNLKVGFEICEDLWVTIPPSSNLALMGANLICNLSASNELVSKSSYRKSLVQNQSARTMCSYIYSSAGVHESTTDLLFSGHMIIAENGTIIKENNRFKRENDLLTGIVDLFKLDAERIKNISFRNSTFNENNEPRFIPFNLENTEIKNFDREIDKHPFLPKSQ